MKYLKLFLLLMILTSCKEEKKEENLLSKAIAIHKRVMTLEAYLDLNISNFTDSINYTQKRKNQKILQIREKVD